MIEVFTHGAPSPRKVTIMLEELGWPYQWHWINAYAGEHKQPAFLAKNPNGRLPALLLLSLCHGGSALGDLLQGCICGGAVLGARVAQRSAGGEAGAVYSGGGGGGGSGGGKCGRLWRSPCPPCPCTVRLARGQRRGGKP